MAHPNDEHPPFGLPGPTTQTPTRQVLCQDALPWLKEQAPLKGCSLVTSLPDVSAFPQLGLTGWKRWFIEAARLTMNATPDEGVTIFYQTDVKLDGMWIDKGYLCQRAAEEAESALLWHKIVCRKPVGQSAFGRPGYSHLLCFSRGVRDKIARSSTDVLASAGDMTWSQAMGRDACELACKYIESHTTTRTIVDPFCGVGTMLAVANQRGLSAIGLEIAQRRARKARKLTFDQLVVNPGGRSPTSTP